MFSVYHNPTVTLWVWLGIQLQIFSFVFLFWLDQFFQTGKTCPYEHDCVHLFEEHYCLKYIWTVCFSFKVCLHWMKNEWMKRSSTDHINRGFHIQLHNNPRKLWTTWTQFLTKVTSSFILISHYLTSTIKASSDGYACLSVTLEQFKSWWMWDKTPLKLHL